MSVGSACGAAHSLQRCKILREALRRYAAKAPAACRPSVLSPTYRRREWEEPRSLCCNAAHAVRSYMAAQFMRENKKRRCGACTTSQRHCFLIVRAVYKALWQKVDYLTVWNHAIRERAAKAACAVWAYLVPLARAPLFPAWAQRAFSLLVGHSF